MEQEFNNTVVIIGTLSFATLIIGVIIAFVKTNGNILKREVAHKKEVISSTFRSQEAERAMISSELHDSVGALLSIAVRETKGLDNTNILNPLEGAMQIVREISHRTYPAILKRIGLAKTVESFLENISQSQDSIEWVFHSNEYEISMESEPQLMLYRICQECINNILKHSQATKFGVDFFVDNSHLRIEIRDNGEGFDYAAQQKDPTKGIGLTGMISRAELINATLSVDSSVGKGTTITIDYPLKK